MYDISLIKSRINCVEYARQMGFGISDSGDRCVSPLRPGAKNKTSFIVYDEFYYDFGAGMGGDVIELCASYAHNGDRGAAIRELARLTGVASDGEEPSQDWIRYTNDMNARVAYYHSKLTDEDRAYLRARGIKDEDAERLKIGRVTDGHLRGRLFLPYFNNGYCCYFATRAMPGGAFPDSKYMKQKKDEYCQHVPWGLQTLNRGGDTLVIAEGYFDAASFEVCGYPVLSAITGCFSHEQMPTVLSVCKSFKRVLLVYDNDERSHAGDKFAHRMAETLAKKQIHFVVGKVPAPYKDISEYYAAGGDLAAILDNAVEDVEFMPKMIFQRLGAPEMFSGKWTVEKKGISCEVVINKKTGEKDLERVTNTPVVPVAIYKNISEGVQKVKLSFLQNGVQGSLICDRETIANKSKIISLANAGLSVNSNNASKLVQYLADMEAYNEAKIPHYKSVSHVGWVGDDFLPYSENIHFDGTEDNKSLFAAIKQSGDFDEWLGYTRELRENIYLRLMMAASFASPLIERVKALPFVFHLWGSTGKGKTVALMVAMSIWGDPSNGALTRTMNMTNAAMMSTVAFLRNLPFGGDELQTIKNVNMNYDQLIMQITEGVERGRMHYNKNLPTRSWKCAFLFTGEERCTNDYSGGGVKNRVIEVEAEGDIVKNGNETVQFISRNYGHAGKKLVEYVADRALAEEYNEILQRLLEESQTTAKQAMAAAMLILGDKLACECFYPSEDPLDVADIIPFLKMESEVDVATRAYHYLVDAVAMNSARFGPGDYGERWGTLERDSVFIIDTALNKVLQDKGFSFDAVKKAWAANGWLVMYKNKYKKKKGIAGQVPYCVEIVLPYGEEVEER